LNEYLKVQVAQQTQQQQPAAVPPAVTPIDNPAPVNAPAPPTNVAAAPIPAYKPPSQTQLAANVAKDVIGNLIPARYRPIVVGTILVLVLLLLWLISRR
jgi:hypothetical protein